MSARDAILARVRTAIAGAAASGPIPREYSVATDDHLDTFLDRLAHYDATTHVVPPPELDGRVRAIVSGRRIVAPAGVPDTWLSGATALTDDPPLSNDALDASDGVLTTCALAIAQTGTIVLDGGPGMGRRALTLLPDYHLCVVRAEQLVSSVPEAIRRLEPTRPLTFISGPSATVDIEMTRVRGVHGPRRLEVIVVTDARPDHGP
ncbi:MAG: lactate utilization protein C [Solirubrobacterales bacterium]|nr:lactate utilization protein C [Solirubrobacterales bacterium]